MYMSRWVNLRALSNTVSSPVTLLGNGDVKETVDNVTIYLHQNLLQTFRLFAVLMFFDVGGQTLVTEIQFVKYENLDAILFRNRQ